MGISRSIHSGDKFTEFKDMNVKTCCFQDVLKSYRILSSQYMHYLCLKSSKEIDNKEKNTGADEIMKTVCVNTTKCPQPPKI